MNDTDNQDHDNPYCAALAPVGSIESVHGELCDKCMRRKFEEEIQTLEHTDHDAPCYRCFVEGELGI